MRIFFYIGDSPDYDVFKVWPMVPRIGDFVMLNGDPFKVVAVTHDETTIGHNFESHVVVSQMTPKEPSQ